MDYVDKKTQGEIQTQKFQILGKIIFCCAGILSIRLIHFNRILSPNDLSLQATDLSTESSKNERRSRTFDFPGGFRGDEIAQLSTRA